MDHWITRKQYYILETETQNMMHYVLYVNLRRDFVEEMCFKNRFYMNEHRYISTETERKKEREKIVGAGQR